MAKAISDIVAGALIEGTDKKLTITGEYMALDYRHLDAATRDLMISEINNDNDSGALYLSSRLNESGRLQWPALLSDAARAFNDDWLANQIQDRSLLNITEQRTSRSTGAVTYARTPSNAHEVMAEGEFNRFYMRGICLRAIGSSSQPVAYRARYSQSPRPESERVIGQSFDPTELLAKLRRLPIVDEALGMPPGPNSGLSIFLP